MKYLMLLLLFLSGCSQCTSNLNSMKVSYRDSIWPYVSTEKCVSDLIKSGHTLELKVSSYGANFYVDGVFTVDICDIRDILKKNGKVK